MKMDFFSPRNKEVEKVWNLVYAEHNNRGLWYPLKTNMAANLRNVQFVSRNIPNLVFIRRGIQNVKHGHRNFTCRAVSRSSRGVMSALTCSRNTRSSPQQLCVPAGGKVKVCNFFFKIGTREGTVPATIYSFLCTTHFPQKILLSPKILLSHEFKLVWIDPPSAVFFFFFQLLILSS